MFIIPYIALLIVCVLFFIVCYFLICGHSRKKSKKACVKKRSKKSFSESGFIHGKNTHEDEKLIEKVAQDTLVVPPLKRADNKDIFDSFEKTKAFSRDELKGNLKSAEKESYKEFDNEPSPNVVGNINDASKLETYFVRHFLNQYGAVSKTVESDTKLITHALISSLNMTDKEACDTLMHLMVQEALQNAQKTYIMMPSECIKGMVVAAFCDVARGSRTDTKTIIAYDALKSMPRMEENSFKALSLLLIFHYSGSSEITDSASINRYAEKYVSPFINDLPDVYSGYQQLEYLHCISLQNKDIAFGEVLHNSYPLIFSYRGAMKSELKELWNFDDSILVPSLYNSYYKLPASDDSLLDEFFDKNGIYDEKIKHHIRALLHSRPVAYDRKELNHILGKISNDLKMLQEEWDTGMLRRSSLTLMGMYIAHIYIREVIGENFDISHWI